MALHWFIEFYECNSNGGMAWCYICAVSTSKADTCLGSAVVKQPCFRLWFFLRAGITDWFMQRRVKAGGQKLCWSGWPDPTSSSRNPHCPCNSVPPTSLSSSSSSARLAELHSVFSYSSFRHPWKFCWLWQKLGRLSVWTVWYAPEFKCCYFLNSQL